MNKFFTYVSIILLFWSHDLDAQSASLVSDSWPGSNGVTNWNKRPPFFFNDMYFYWTLDSLAGWELWRTDGTPSGTFMIKDINPGPSHSWYQMPQSFFGIVNNHLLFAAHSDSVGAELWSTDGTPGGTILIKDISNIPGQGVYHYQTDFLIYNNILYFIAKDSLGRNAWISDGTNAGTKRAVNCPANNNSAMADAFRVLNGTVLFETDSMNHSKLFSIQMVGGNPVSNDITPPGILNFIGYHLRDGVELNNAIYFVADYLVFGNSELYKTTGTSSNLVKDINPGNNGSDISLTVDRGFIYNGQLYFNTVIDTIGNVLCSLNPVTDSISQNVFMDPGGLGIAKWGTAILYNNKIFYWGSDSIHAIEPWISDGTPGGTFMLQDINPLNISGQSNSQEFHIQNNILLFYGYDQTHHQEWWRTDGTVSGTYMLPECNSNGSASDGQTYQDFVANNIRYYSDNEATGITELFYTDGTLSGSGKIDLYSGTSYSSFPSFINYDGQKYFLSCNTQQYGAELWSTNGSTNGFLLYADMSPGNTTWFYRDFTFIYNGDMYFAADTGIHNNLEIWKTDHVNGGVVQLTNFPPPADSISKPYILSNRYVLFTHRTDSLGAELWVMDCPGIINNVSNRNHENNFKFFPVPSNGKLSIEFEKIEGEKTIRIFDMKGKCLRHFTSEQNGVTVDLSEYDNGIYFIQYISKDLFESRKIILSK